MIEGKTTADALNRSHNNRSGRRDRTHCTLGGLDPSQNCARSYNTAGNRQSMGQNLRRISRCGRGV
jgi:hypothetical protein